jgi:hypothetical protein
MLITYHQKTERDGWQPVCTRPIESPEWDRADRFWLDHLERTGSLVVTCGESMWEVKK